MKAAQKIMEGLAEAVEYARSPVAAFVEESNRIEGIYSVKATEVKATEDFMALQVLSVEAICRLQSVYAPGMPIRDRVGMNVRVGTYTAPGGGRTIIVELMSLVGKFNRRGPYANPWALHVEFERIHPFMDGNGRTGRAIWAWHMKQCGMDPFALPFLHRFYYQTLENDPRR